MKPRCVPFISFPGDYYNELNVFILVCVFVFLQHIYVCINNMWYCFTRFNFKWGMLLRSYCHVFISPSFGWDFIILTYTSNLSIFVCDMEFYYLKNYPLVKRHLGSFIIFCYYKQCWNKYIFRVYMDENFPQRFFIFPNCSLKYSN